MSTTQCVACQSEHIYEDRGQWICPECGHEWVEAKADSAASEAAVVRDANGNILSDGDTVSVIKDLKIKGSSSVVKVGTKAKGIRLIDGADDHNIACKLEGFGQMNLKSEFVKKV